MTQHRIFDRDGFRFDLKVQPVFGWRLRDDASPAAREAWNAALAAGIHPERAASTLDSHRVVEAWRVSLRAETTKPYSEIADEAWPSETYVNVSGDGSSALLVCHAAVEIRAGEDLLERAAQRLALEGPVGEEAARAFYAASLEPVEMGRASTALVGTVLWLGAAALTGLAVRLGGWARFGIAAGIIGFGALALVLTGGLEVEHREATVHDLDEWRRNPFRGS